MHVYWKQVPIARLWKWTKYLLPWKVIFQKEYWRKHSYSPHCYEIYNKEQQIYILDIIVSFYYLYEYNSLYVYADIRTSIDIVYVGCRK